VLERRGEVKVNLLLAIGSGVCIVPRQSAKDMPN
jgi:hypothetical protein